jgi:hypothetical protein
VGAIGQQEMRVLDCCSGGEAAVDGEASTPATKGFEEALLAAQQADEVVAAKTETATGPMRISPQIAGFSGQFTIMVA